MARRIRYVPYGRRNVIAVNTSLSSLTVGLVQIYESVLSFEL